MCTSLRIQFLVTISCIAAILVAGCGASHHSGSSGGDGHTGSLSVTTPGARPEMLSGHTALIAIAHSAHDPGLGAALYDAGNLSAKNITVILNGKNVTDQFKYATLKDGGTAVLGRVDSLTPGSNHLAVRTDNGDKASLTLTDYPISGPIFSGPHEEPYFCQTLASGLGKPIDPENCDVKTTTQYVYLPRHSNHPEPFDPDNPPNPGDIATTTTSDGHSVPFIVREETGTINRAIYHIALLDDPAHPGPDPWTPTPGWNGRLVYAFGGHCGPGHHQGKASVTPDVLNRALLSKGYAVATSTLNVLGVNCNAPLSAETALMVKQHFVARFGLPVYTIGMGSSGGAIQQYMIADNYPGILDGITPSHAFPDYLFAPGVSDCGLLVHYFQNSKTNWTPEQRAAASGERNFRSCYAWSHGAAEMVDATTGCDSSIPHGFVFDPQSNPDGIRCTLWDHLINILGTDPKTGFARDPLDNIGVEYGLQALNNGVITPQQFIDLNQHIGGYDVNGNIVPQREKGNVESIETTYATGQITTAEGGLPLTPIIDWRPYLDASGNLHTRFYSFSVRRRLLKASGTAANQVILVEPPPAQRPAPITQPSTIASMDQWLANIRADSSDKSLARKIAADKPAGLADSCYAPSGKKITEPASYGSTGQCNHFYPPYGDPRTGAGEPIAVNILKCQLKALKASDYAPSVHFTSRQMAALKTIFPNGVCDWSKPSVGKVPYQGTWASFGT